MRISLSPLSRSGSRSRPMRDRARVALLALCLALPSRSMSEDRQALRVFVTGPSESGKNRLLDHLFTRRTDRVIAIDVTGEIAERDPEENSTVRTFGLEDLRDTLRRVATHKKWRIVSHIDEDEIAPLFRLLMPPITSVSSASYPRAVGGLALECGEASFLFANGRTSKEARAANFSGRHHRLSMYLAAQRPTSVDPSVRSEAHLLVAFGHRQKLDLDWWRDATSSEISDVISELPRYHSLTFSPASGRVQVLDAAYRPYRVLDLKGRIVASRDRPRLVGQS